MKRQFAVFGLGSFGRSVALTLENLGCDVVVVDKSYEKIQEISALMRCGRMYQILMHFMH